MTKCRSLHFCLLDELLLKLYFMYLRGKGHGSPILLLPSKRSELVLGEVCKVSDVSHRQTRCGLNNNVITKRTNFLSGYIFPK